MSVRLFKSLLFKATLIQRQIEDEHKRVRPDHFRLLKLKKIRLAIKDRLARIFQGGLVLQPARIAPSGRRTVRSH